MNKKASNLLLDSIAPLDVAFIKIKQLEKDFERVIGYLEFLGIDAMDGSPTAEDIYAMRIQELERKLGESKTETNNVKKELYDFQESIIELTKEKPKK